MPEATFLASTDFTAKIRVSHLLAEKYLILKVLELGDEGIEGVKPNKRLIN